MNIVDIARVCHEVNRAYCNAIGDTSQVAWEEAADWQRQSAINGVSYTLANPDAKPEDQHEAWMRDKIKDGWTYGKVKDAEAKTHPCIMSYNRLPFEQRAKDALFQVVVWSLAARNADQGEG